MDFDWINYRYTWMEVNKYDTDDVINNLDAWLEQWLYYKDHCPSCGHEDINI